MRPLPYCIVPLLLAAPGLACACWEQTAARYDVPAPLLRAIARVESGMNPSAVNRGHYHRTGTVDIGYMQVNSSPGVLRHLGVTEDALFDPCVNIDTGARILAEKMARHGRTWEAVGAYNAACVTMTVPQCLRVRMRYAWRVYHALTGRTAYGDGAVVPLAVAATIDSVSLP